MSFIEEESYEREHGLDIIMMDDSQEEKDMVESFKFHQIEITSDSKIQNKCVLEEEIVTIDSLFVSILKLGKMEMIERPSTKQKIAFGMSENVSMKGNFNIILKFILEPLFINKNVNEQKKNVLEMWLSVYSVFCKKNVCEWYNNTLMYGESDKVLAFNKELLATINENGQHPFRKDCNDTIWF